MVLTETRLRSLLYAEKELLRNRANFIACDECNSREVEHINKQIETIDRVLNGKELITIADDSVVEYFKSNSINV